MSLFNLNRIYKPNRHTPTPLTQTHTITFPLCCYLFLLPSHQHRCTAETGSVRISSAVKKKSEGNCLRWWEVLSAGGSGGRMDGWIEGTFCSSCAGSHIVPGEAGCHLWFKGPNLSTDGNRTWPLWHPPHSFLKEHQIKHAWDVDRGGPATSLFTLPFCCFTLLSLEKKALRGLHLPNVERAQRWSDAFKKQEDTLIFRLYYII